MRESNFTEYSLKFSRAILLGSSKKELLNNLFSNVVFPTPLGSSKQKSCYSLILSPIISVNLFLSNSGNISKLEISLILIHIG